MNIPIPLSHEQKLTVVYRVEPGCLGPDGKDHIESFCQLAQKSVVDLDADFIHWEIEPRYDKALPEMQYRVSSKELSHDKADQYLQLFGKSLDEFEYHIQGEFIALINQYFGR